MNCYSGLWGERKHEFGRKIHALAFRCIGSDQSLSANFICNLNGEWKEVLGCTGTKGQMILDWIQRRGEYKYVLQSMQMCGRHSLVTEQGFCSSPQVFKPNTDVREEAKGRFWEKVGNVCTFHGWNWSNATKPWEVEGELGADLLHSLSVLKCRQLSSAHIKCRIYLISPV